VIRKGMTVTFVHSGGIPELYARSGAELLE